jgi:hypothetical protein
MTLGNRSAVGNPNLQSGPYTYFKRCKTRQKCLLRTVWKKHSYSVMQLTSRELHTDEVRPVRYRRSDVQIDVSHHFSKGRNEDVADFAAEVFPNESSTHFAAELFPNELSRRRMPSEF